MLCCAVCIRFVMFDILSHVFFDVIETGIHSSGNLLDLHASFASFVYSFVANRTLTRGYCAMTAV